jgi:hypothetical protein
MKSFLRAILDWPWLYLATACALVVPWFSYAIAGYIEADSQFQMAVGTQHWMQPNSDLLPISAAITFVTVMMVGAAADRFKKRSG